VDGTLIDTLADIAGSVNWMLEVLGLPARSHEEVRTFVGRGVEQLVLRSIGEGRTDLLDQGLSLFRDHYEVHCLDHSRLLPGAAECLETFADRDLGVVSNKTEHFVRRMLEALGALGRFRVVYGGDSLPERKPSPLMVRAALDVFGRSPGEGILVGDLPIDVETGRAAGVYTVALLGGFGTREELEASSPDLMIEDLWALRRLFA
jgi:phosphoglycolate phosphatase